MSQLIGMEFEEDRCRQAVFITANMDDAVSCCLDEDTFNERLQEFVQAADIGNAKEGLRRLGPRTAAANLSTVGQVPPSLKGNAGQGAKSSMAIVNLGTGVVASLPETPKPEQDAAGPVARAGPAQPPAQPPASPLAPPLEAAPLAADHERSARKYAEKLRKALASAPAAARVTLAQTMVEHVLHDLSPEERAAAIPRSLAPAPAQPPKPLPPPTLLPPLPPPGPPLPPPAPAESPVTFEIYVKTTQDNSIMPIDVHEELTVLEVKQAVQQALQARGREALQPSAQRLFFGGKPLGNNSQTVGSLHLQKQSTVHLLPKGASVAPLREMKASFRDDDEDEGEDEAGTRVSTADDDAGGSSSTATVSAPGPTLRTHKINRSLEFDGSDGWAVAERINVIQVQRWYRLNKAELRWEEWKNGNRLVYLLNRTSGFTPEVASFLTDRMGNTALGNAGMWQDAHECLLDIDRQLRRVFISPYLASSPPLLGNATDGPFVLGYVQVSQMPVALREQGKRVEGQAKVQAEGRSLGMHFDAAAYGDVIITVTAFGRVSIVLKNRTDLTMAHELLGIERGSRMPGGDAEMSEGDAYSIVGKARWKMNHDAIVPPTCPAIPGLDDGMVGGIARVGLTFRYFRRTFLELRQRQQLVAQPSTTLPAVFDYVDAPYFIDGAVDTAHLYTYAAIVLRVDAASRCLTLQYLSDGLGPDTDEEAFHVADGVPSDCVLPMHPSIQGTLQAEDCPWTRKSLRLVQRIREMGVDAYLRESEQ